MNQSFDSTGAQFVWDSTSLKLAATCWRKYEYKMIEGWSPRGTSPHLLFGGWYASALEHYYKHRALGMDHEAALLEVVTEAMQNTWVYDLDEEGNAIPESGKPWDGMHNLKTRENLIRTIVWYLEEFGDNDNLTTYILADGKPAVELTFALPVDNDIIFSGHLDRLVHYSDDLYVSDQKTTGTTISQKFFNDFDLDTQMTMYPFAGKMIYKTPVKGVIIDGAQIAVGFSRFARGFTFRSDGQLNEWYDEMMELTQQARLRAQRKEFPRNLTACTQYGRCEFFDVCSRPPEHREAFLRGDFIKGKGWDPSARR